jgi:hypothetical protein
MAKSVIDIAVGVKDLNAIADFIPTLERDGSIHKAANDNGAWIFFSWDKFINILIPFCNRFTGPIIFVCPYLDIVLQYHRDPL